MTNHNQKKNNILKNLICISTIALLIVGIIEVEVQAADNKHISVQKRIVSLKLGQATNINYTANQNNDVEYYSNNRMVATIDPNGNIIGNMIGSTTVVGKDKGGDVLETVVIVYRDLLEPLSEISEPRYTLENGVYTNKSAKNTNDALLMFTGDLMCQTRQQEAGKTEDGTYVFNDSFNMVKDIFSKADFVAGNLESLLSNTSPYMSEEKELGGQPHCNGPSTYLDALKYAGFDALVNSNNHIADDGEMGILQTLDLLEQYKFAYTGSFRDKDEQRFIIVDVNGIKIALMSYSEDFNEKDITLDEDIKEVMINRYTKEAIEKDVKDAKAMGAEYIIAYNHWGEEYTNDYNEDQAKSAEEMANAGVDFIIGSHPHALQTFEVIKTRDNRKVPVVYSLGNFISHQYKPVTKDNFILTLNLKRDKEGKVYLADEGYIPCYVFEEYDSIPYLVTPISKDFNGGIENSELNESYMRIQDVVNATMPEITSYSQLKK
ncbi:CapA family protein [Terrisporobacter mayombei]|uniref:Capsule synthesis protein CapA domain-containing protein n=1 Tax=Terrisporobacter mayombei TaxID=1541 RepID=A0ABY9Q2E4_9FIRM|nr:CapA family protein [Terrisporobacter mayombei]MCC3869312.1 CapA family protein [Terrisporobacter mayombei]WMT82143.1 hypothetical protein TEMA_25010 [Terrisporobacter mayombei]